MPTCLECGYDLRGLELPHRCPECGRLEDSQQAAEEVCTWFASKRAIWLRSAPPCFVAHLHEPRCRRIALRRLLACLLLPWLLLVGVVVTLSCVTITRIYERTPSRIHAGVPKPDPDGVSRQVRAFGGRERHYASGPWDFRRVETFVGFARPEVSQGTHDVLALFPALAVCGVIATWVCTRLAIVRQNARSAVPLSVQAATAACGLIAGPMYLLMASGIAWAILEAVNQWEVIARPASDWLSFAALATGVGAFVLGGAVVQYKIVHNCQPRRPTPVIAGLVGAVGWLLLLFLVGCAMSAVWSPLSAREL